MVSSAVFFTVDNQFISLAIWHAFTFFFNLKIASSMKDIDLMMLHNCRDSVKQLLLTIHFKRERKSPSVAFSEIILETNERVLSVRTCMPNLKKKKERRRSKPF